MAGLPTPAEKAGRDVAGPAFGPAATAWTVLRPVLPPIQLRGGGNYECMKRVGKA